VLGDAVLLYVPHGAQQCVQDGCLHRPGDLRGRLYLPGSFPEEEKDESPARLAQNSITKMEFFFYKKMKF